MHKVTKILLETWKHWREISFVYLIQLLVGTIVGLSFFDSMFSSFEDSMVLDQLAKGFDRTVIMDIINSDSAVLNTTKGIALSLFGIYLFISVLLQAGWLANTRKMNYSVKTLLSSGLNLFFPFLGIAILALLLIFVYAVVVGIGFTKIVGDPLVTFSSEVPYVIWIIVLAGFFILWSIIIWAWSLSSRYHFIDGNSFFTSLKLGIITIWKKLFKFLTIGLLLVGIHVILMYFYYLIMEDRGASSWLIVLFGILVHQIFAFTRVVIRGFGYSLIENLMSKKV